MKEGESAKAAFCKVTSMFLRKRIRTHNQCNGAVMLNMEEEFLKNFNKNECIGQFYYFWLKDIYPYLGEIVKKQYLCIMIKLQ